MPIKDWEARLTPREYEVLMLLPSGKTNVSIAYELGITAGTVKMHIRAVLRKLGVSSRLQAAVIAAKHRIEVRPQYYYQTAA